MSHLRKTSAPARKAAALAFLGISLKDRKAGVGSLTGPPNRHHANLPSKGKTTV